MTKSLWQPFVWWVYGAIVTTALCGLVAVTVQQNYRQSANDPQIQMAEDAAKQLTDGASPYAVAPQQHVFIDASLAPWVAVLDTTGNIIQTDLNIEDPNYKVASSGFMNGSGLFVLPKGVFDTSNASARVDDPIWIRGEYRFTWQPEPGVRQAVVLVQTQDGKYFVAAGRSLREVEVRENRLNFFVVAAWLATLAALAVWSAIAWWLLKSR